MTRPLTFEQAKALYVYRYTLEHKPAWAKHPAPNGKYYAPQFASDREWYENTKFYGEPGHIGRKRDCFTTGQTWPKGQWLE